MDYTKLLFEEYGTVMLTTQQVSNITGRSVASLEADRRVGKGIKFKRLGDKHNSPVRYPIGYVSDWINDNEQTSDFIANDDYIKDYEKQNDKSVCLSEDEAERVTELMASFIYGKAENGLSAYEEEKRIAIKIAKRAKNGTENRIARMIRIAENIEKRTIDEKIKKMEEKVNSIKVRK